MALGTTIRRLLDACRKQATQFTRTTNSLRAGLPRWRGICVVCVAGWLAIIAAGVTIYLSSQEKPDTIKIAFVARRVTDPTRTLNQKTELVLKHYLSELEKERPRWHFELDPFYVDSINTGGVWSEIAEDPSYTFVVDNAWGENMLQAGGIIKLHELPVISLNSDKLQADPGDQALFLGHADLYPNSIAAFVKGVLGHDKVHFVTEKSYPLTEYFIEEFKAREIDYSSTFTLEGDADTLKAQALLASLARQPDLPVVLNTHYEWGESILRISETDSSIRGITFIGPPAIVSGANMDGFGGGGSGNEFYMISEPVDALTHKVTADLRRFKEEADFWNDSTSDPQYVKRCLDAVEIIRHALDHDGHREYKYAKERRQAMARTLGNLKGDILLGQHDLYTFDEGGRIVHEATFVHHANGAKQSYPLQINSSYERIDNIVVGIELLDVSDLNPSTNSFKADFLYWTVEPKLPPGDASPTDSSACDPSPDLSEPDTPPVFFHNLKQAFSQRLLLERHTRSTERDLCLHYRRYQVSGEFHHSYALHEYPIDEQEPALQIGIINPFDNLRISFDPTMLDQYNNKASTQAINIPGWTMARAPYSTVENRITSALRGDPTLARARPHKFKSLHFWIPMKRGWLGQFFVVALPLFTIGSISILLLFSPNPSYEIIGDVAVGVFLSIITYSIAYTQLTPASNVLTKADHLFYGTFLVVMASFAWVIFANIFHKSDQLHQKGVGGAFRVSRIILLLVYVTWVALIPSL